MEINKPYPFKPTATDVENVAILRAMNPHMTTDVEALRFGLSAAVSSQDAAKVRKIRRELQASKFVAQPA